MNHNDISTLYTHICKDQLESSVKIFTKMSFGQKSIN